jgi:chaperonin GroES
MEATQLKETTPTNLSGIFPIGLRVLVHPDPIENKSAGGIVLPADIRKQHGQAQQAGTIVAAGESAWHDHTDAPSVGDRVLFARHQGEELTGLDGDMYRVLNDTQIAARLASGVELTDLRSREGYRQ